MNEQTNEVQETETVAATEAVTTRDGKLDHTEKAAPSTEEYEQALSELRKESAGHRAKLKELELLESKRKDAQMSDAERAETRIKELEAQATSLKRQAQDSEIRAHAASLRFADPSDAVAFIERDSIDEDGGNISSLLQSLLKAKPYLAKDAKPIPATAAANPGGGAEKASEKAREEELKKAFPTLGRRVSGLGQAFGVGR